MRLQRYEKKVNRPNLLPTFSPKTSTGLRFYRVELTLVKNKSSESLGGSDFSLYLCKRLEMRHKIS